MSFCRRKRTASNGTAIHETKNETTSPEAIVTASALKNAPATPERKASGTKITIVEADDPASGRVNSAAARSTRPSYGPSPRRSRRITCSTITIASSMISPTAAAMPPRVMMLKLMSIARSSSTVEASTTGTVSAAITVTRRFRRNRSSTSPARTIPTRTASRTLVDESTISRLWSYHVATFTSAGSRRRSSSSFPCTPRAIATVLPPGCWKTLKTTASRPSAVTRVHCGAVPGATVATSERRTTPFGPLRIGVAAISARPRNSVSARTR